MATENVIPAEPPEIYTPEFGTEAEYIAATRAYAAYWAIHAHEFEPCRQCESCGLCFRCGLARDAAVHSGCES